MAAELEARWEAALRAVTQAEDATVKDKAQTVIPCVLTAELKAAFSKIGERLPPLWGTQVLSQQQRKALRRCLIDKVTLHRVARSQAQVRIVWRGGETTTFLVPVQVKSIAALPWAAEMEALIRAFFAEGHRDEAMAQQLTELGHRSPSSQAVLPKTVRIIRLQHRLFQQRSQSHPRHIAGFLTVPQIAGALEVPVHWIDDHIHRGTMAITKDPTTKLYVSPDRLQTLKLFKALQSGKRRHIQFHESLRRGSRAPEAAVIS